MKKMSKKLSLQTQTLRYLTNEQMTATVGGSLGSSGTSVISVSGGTSVIQPGTIVMTITSGGTSVISRGGH